MTVGAGADQWATHQLLSVAARLVERRWDEALAALGLTHTAVLALQALAAAGPLNQERLAGLLRLKGQTLGRVLPGLENSGLIRRETPPRNKRSIDVQITERGRQILEAAHRAEREVLPPDLDRRSALHGELARIVESFPAPAVRHR